MTFMVEAEAERLIGLGEELFEEEAFTADIDALRRIGFVRCIVPAADYTEARRKAVARFRVRGLAEDFVLDGVFGAKECVLSGGESLFIVVGTL
jgi:hypothetical protein